MTKLQKILLSSLGMFALFMPVAQAVCPVCTVAVGAGLEGARMLGVDDVIVGLWAGGLTLSIFFWTASWLKKKGVKSVWGQIIAPFVICYALLAGVYLLPSVNFGECTLWGIDKLFLGIVVGTFAFYFGVRWHSSIKRKNGGKSKFPFQKVVMPLSFLIIATIVFAVIVRC